jgi:hypothetical protein
VNLNTVYPKKCHSDESESIEKILHGFYSTSRPVVTDSAVYFKPYPETFHPEKGKSATFEYKTVLRQNNYLNESVAFYVT